MKRLLMMGLVSLFLMGLIGCSDSDSASSGGTVKATNSLVLPEQLEVVTNEN